ncbi:hypothetical protein EVAR_48850_1 [Eumeta japonica]|uniref:Uncharacterized protein n=1 Tax=Eumeta variegata TaxID=151549 RepID=A0A4C1YA06_EUMVA|nr:hypothetical protein EVAR_48850_1 [Eumeta japonica]
MTNTQTKQSDLLAHYILFTKDKGPSKDLPPGVSQWVRPSLNKVIPRFVSFIRKRIDNASDMYKVYSTGKLVGGPSDSRWRVDGHCRPWTLRAPKESPVRCRLLGRE